MEFWIFVLAVWLVAEWLMRRSYQRRNDERFANIVDALNRGERDFGELKKLVARVADSEKRSATHEGVAPSVTVVAAPPPLEFRISATLRGPEPTVSSQLPRSETPPAASPSPPKLPRPASPPSTPVPHAQAVSPVVPKPPVPPRPAEPVLPARPAPPPRPVMPAQIPEAPAPAAAHVQRKSSELEEKLGKNWLNKIGIVALVIGIALFLAYKFPTLSNPEKVGLGYFVSFAILGLGVYLERKDPYRIFACALIGGSWALVFFTTYAMHFVKYTQVIDTEWVDLVLLFAVAWLMVAHTVHYNSQVVTGLAFLLGLTTVAIS
jgi:uncharacterized membrane protein